MIYLLHFRLDGATRLLPVADQTAAQLERALLLHDVDLCQAALVEAISLDPFLAAWISHQAQRDERLLASVRDAATWFGDEFVEKLSSGLASMDAADAAGCQRVPARDARRYARMCAGVFARADGTAATASWPAETQQWSAIIDAGAALLASCPQQAWAGARQLPAFSPVPPLAQMASPVAPQEARHVSEGERPSPREQRLLEEIPEIQWRLPAMVTRLVQATTAERMFDERLEMAKLASLKELAYGAGHEINNPLANIAARAQTLLRDEAAPERRRKLQAIFDQAMRAHEMIADLMLFAHPPALALSECDLVDLVRTTVAQLAEEAAHREIELIASVERAAVRLEVDRAQMCMALRALVVNAIEAVAHGGRVEVCLLAPILDREVQIVVRDNGPGIDDQVRAHIFDPFFSGREAGRGLGFGLSKCWRIVTDHGGTIRVGSIAGGGAEFTLSLPQAPAHLHAA